MFIEFIDDLLFDMHTEGGGTVIHCSAGVGRTGTVFVVLKICLDKRINLETPASLKELLSREPQYKNTPIVTYQNVKDAIIYTRQKRIYSVQDFLQLYFICKLFNLFDDLKADVLEKKQINLSDIEVIYAQVVKTKETKDAPNNTITVSQIKKKLYSNTNTILNLFNNKISEYTENLTPEQSTQKETCKTHNRYSNIIPFYSSIVTLPELPNQPCSTYINASILTDDEHEGKFNGTVIATQCPTSYSTQNFLRMLNEKSYDIKRIVMLTGFKEKTENTKQPKCIDYTTNNFLQNLENQPSKLSYGYLTQFNLKLNTYNLLELTDGNTIKSERTQTVSNLSGNSVNVEA